MRHSISTNAPIPSVLGGAEHHRRINSVKTRQDAMYVTPTKPTNTPTTKAAGCHPTNLADSHRLAAWKYPASKDANSSTCSSDDVSETSPCASTASSPSTAGSPETILHAGVWHEQGSPAPFAPTRASAHRFSPSLPFGSGPVPSTSRVRLQSHTPASISRRNTFSYRLLGWTRIMFNALRRTRPVEALYLLAFATAFVTFAAALAGVGYVPPPEKVALPLAADALAAQRLSPQPTVLPLQHPVGQQAKEFTGHMHAAPVVIREDEDEAATVPVWAQHHDDANEEAQAAAWTDDMIRNSPDSLHLDDNHAAHVHHNADENIYERAPAGHVHHHDVYHAIEEPLELIEEQYDDATPLDWAEEPIGEYRIVEDDYELNEQQRMVRLRRERF